MIKKFKRLLIHFLSPLWLVKRKFTTIELERLEQFIVASEKKHFGEIKFVIESNFSIRQIFNNLTPRQRALEWFGKLGIWDTKENTGVLIYIAYADKSIEIIADRGISLLVNNIIFDEICILMSNFFKKNQYINGLEVGLKEVDKILTKNIPNTQMLDDDEISNDIVLK